MKNFKVVIAVLLVFFTSCKVNKSREIAREKSEILLEEISNGTALKEFPEKYFPKNQGISILENLKNACDFKKRRGNYINDFYKENINGINTVSFIYEFYLKCDSIRFIITYNLNPSIELSGFRLESIKKNNEMILKPERRLKF